MGLPARDHSTADVPQVARIGIEETRRLLNAPCPPPLSSHALESMCARLSDRLEELYSDLVAATQLETGFIMSDSEEVVRAAIDYVSGFPHYLAGLSEQADGDLVYNDGQCDRRITLTRVPWGTVVVILPQSAFLFLAATCLLNGLCTGNRVILRAPAQSAGSAALLNAALESALVPGEHARLVLASARDFIDAVCASPAPALVHYLGSSTHAPDIIAKCFQAGKHVLIDGEGNTWVYVDRDVDQDYACEVLTSGALRYNGQTCTSVNGAVIHPDLYDCVRELLAGRWGAIAYGDPLTRNVAVGPLLDEAQASAVLERAASSGAEVLAGGVAAGSLLAPTLAADPDPDSDLVRSGFFGPALWIRPGDFEEFTRLWPSNRFPLCAGALTAPLTAQQIAARLPNAARVCVNGDPSIEHVYEPWGGYPATGTNPVSHWRDKYTRVVQVDQPLES